MSQKNNSLTGNEHFISLTAAAGMTKAYRTSLPRLLQPDFQQAGALALSETFDRRAIDALLAQPGCAGIRIYYGLDEHLKIHAVLVGVDATNADILASATGRTVADADDEIIVEMAQRCPDECPPPSPLNS
ncbi:MAG: hypothetical protein EOO03_01380 [Chitinophagaceae bacterium]|nr:MAG: hypothetical protein EOO03_01380 [Chitinophagaceae bacterium]